ncbi:DUF624 domain-containing protein [Arthrobacter oryzae]|uniref:DUF624 domain-containing protein n=1 Tax=Arthrobacter oryzae TaxID=409290 RepID=UPI0016067703|nr:DUF624 domain-containing protein [Arthrobacter oryzae]
MTTPPRRRWEHKVLGFLSYPANIALGGVAALVLALPLVTLLPAAIALARAFSTWRETGNDAVFTNTFREFGATWRRSLVIGLVSLVILVILVADIVFLVTQLTVGGAPQPVILVSAAVIPIGAVVSLVLLSIPVAAAQHRDETARHWIRAAVGLVVAKPLASLGILVVLLTVLLACIALPTLVPFAGMSVPIYAAIVLWGTPAGDSSPR